MISQEKRLRAAIETLRPTLSGLRPLNAAERSKYAAQVTNEQWTRRTFNVSWRWRASWKGSCLDVLHEMSFYLQPRATWATRREKGEAWVRPEVTWTLLALVRHRFGVQAAKVLRAAYVANGVKYRPRRVLTDAQRKTMAARLKRATRKPAAMAGASSTRRRLITFDD